jgi:hypothetical protein
MVTVGCWLSQKRVLYIVYYLCGSGLPAPVRCCHWVQLPRQLPSPNSELWTQGLTAGVASAHAGSRRLAWCVSRGGLVLRQRDTWIKIQLVRNVWPTEEESIWSIWLFADWFIIYSLTRHTCIDTSAHRILLNLPSESVSIDRWIRMLQWFSENVGIIKLKNLECKTPHKRVTNIWLIDMNNWLSHFLPNGSPIHLDVWSTLNTWIVRNTNEHIQMESLWTTACQTGEGFETRFAKPHCMHVVFRPPAGSDQNQKGCRGAVMVHLQSTTANCGATRRTWAMFLSPPQDSQALKAAATMQLFKEQVYIINARVVCFTRVLFASSHFVVAPVPAENHGFRISAIGKYRHQWFYGFAKALILYYFRCYVSRK